MPFDSNGTYNRIRSWVSDAAASIPIRSDYHDDHDGDMASALSQVITKDGRTQPTANIPLNNKKITNLGEPTGPSDAATKNYVDSFKVFTTGAEISGANYPNGMVYFSAATGINGLSWNSINGAWVAKKAEANKYPDRLVFHSNKDGTSGSDLISLDKAGDINVSSGNVTNNLSNDGGTWRVDAIGTGTIWQVLGGAVRALANDAVTVAANFAATLRTFFEVTNTDGTVTANFDKSASAKGVYLYGKMATKNRWQLSLGDATAEGGSNAGSNFSLYAYSDDGLTAYSAMFIYRSTQDVIFYKNVTVNVNMTVVGALAVNGSAAISGNLTANIATAGYLVASSNIVAGGSSLLLRPNGYGSATGQIDIDTDMLIWHYLKVGGSGVGGIMERNGSSGSNGSSPYNFNYVPGLQAWVSDTNLGTISFTCDYRIKKEVAPLASTWDAVKRLRPVKYTPAEFFDGEQMLSLASDETRWGFIAHEVQEALIESAAEGVKDEAHRLQSLNLPAIIAALTAALQEAQLRIEALEDVRG